MREAPLCVLAKPQSHPGALILSSFCRCQNKNKNKKKVSERVSSVENFGGKELKDRTRLQDHTSISVFFKRSCLMWDIWVFALYIRSEIGVDPVPLRLTAHTPLIAARPCAHRMKCNVPSFLNDVKKRGGLERSSVMTGAAGGLGSLSGSQRGFQSR